MSKKKSFLIPLIIIFIASNSFAQSADKDFAAADSLIKINQFEKSIPLLDKLINSLGEKEQYLTNRAFAYMQLNDLQKAKADYQRAIALNPNCSKCIGNLGIIENESGDYIKAMNYFDQYIKLEPAKALGYIKKGEIESQLRKFDEALKDLNKAAELDANSPYIYLWLAITKLSMGNAKAALDDISRSIQYKPEVEYAYFVRSKCYIQLEQYQPAWSDLMVCLKKNSKFSEYHTYAGIVLYRLNQYSQAMQAFNESTNLDAGNYLPYQQRSYLQYDMGNFDESCADKEKAKAYVAKQPLELSAAKEITEEIFKYCNNNNSSFYSLRGNTLLNLGEPQKAIVVFDEGIVKFRTNPALYNGRANAAMFLGKFNDALGNYNQSLANIDKLNVAALATRENPDLKNATAFFKSELYNSVAFAQANLLNFDSAIINLSKSITLLYDNPGIFNRPLMLAEYIAKRGAFYSFQKKYKEADKDIAEALRINPKCVTALLNRATMMINKNTIADKEVKNLASNFPPSANQPYTYITTPAKNLSREEVIAAVKDCDIAIRYQPGNAMAYMRRAQANLILNNESYCDDVQKAVTLGIKEAPIMLGVNCK
jgi:tetratricopeptide (TPR) repeat protein